MKTKGPRLPGTERRAAVPVALALAAVSALIFINLGSESLLGDESLYAAVALDSLNAGAWFPLVYDGEPYTGKPPLGIWLQRIAFSLFGFDEIVARAPSALFGALALGLFAVAGARRHGPFVAILSATLLGTGHFLLIRHGLRQAVFEGPLLLATVGAVLALTHPAPTRRGAIGAAAWCALGAAFKGPVGPALLLVIGVAYYGLADRPPGFARRLALAVGSGLAVCGLWLGAIFLGTQAGPFEFLKRDIWERATVGIDAEHVAGIEVYRDVLVRDFGWWLLLPLAGAAVSRFRRQASSNAPSVLAGIAAPSASRHSAWALAAAWAFAPTLLLLLSASKLSWYLYPALPGYALLVALGADAIRLRLVAYRRPVATVFVVLVLALLVPRYATRLRRVAADRPEQVTLRQASELAATDPRAVVVLDPGAATAPKLREWHWLYFQFAPRRQVGVDRRLAADDCPILVTPRPEEAARRLGIAADPRSAVFQVTAREEPLWIVDGCGGRVAAGLARVKAPPG